MTPAGRVLRVGLALLALALAAPSASAQTGASAAAARTLAPGDSLRIMVWRNAEMSGSFLVAADGALRHPLYQGIQVADVPLAEVRARVGQFLQRYVDTPEFVVEPLFRVVIGGQVGAPGVYFHVPETSVAQAVASAGGALPSGAQSSARLVRDGTSLSVDLTRPDLGAAAEPVHSGDQIVVPPRRTLQTVLSGATGLLSLVSVVLVTLSLVGI